MIFFSFFSSIFLPLFDDFLEFRTTTFDGLHFKRSSNMYFEKVKKVIAQVVLNPLLRIRVPRSITNNSNAFRNLIGKYMHYACMWCILISLPYPYSSVYAFDKLKVFKYKPNIRMCFCIEKKLYSLNHYILVCTVQKTFLNQNMGSRE